MHTEMGVDQLIIPVHNDSVGGIYLCECSHCHDQVCGKCFRVGGESGIECQPLGESPGESPI